MRVLLLALLVSIAAAVEPTSLYGTVTAENCTAGDFFMKKCEYCICIGGGQAACTKICGDPGGAQPLT